jgi:hypothetical protein
VHYLQETPSLRAARSSAGAVASINSCLRSLGVRYVLEGAVQRDQSRVRSPRLLDALTDAWSRSDIFNCAAFMRLKRFLDRGALRLPLCNARKPNEDIGPARERGAHRLGDPLRPHPKSIAKSIAVVPGSRHPQSVDACTTLKWRRAGSRRAYATSYPASFFAPRSRQSRAARSPRWRQTRLG